MVKQTLYQKLLPYSDWLSEVFSIVMKGGRGGVREANAMSFQAKSRRARNNIIVYVSLEETQNPF